jgi:hypothetical protein
MQWCASILLYRFDDMMFQAVRNEQRGLVVGSLIPIPKIPSSNPRLKLQKKTKKTVATHHNKFLGVNAKKTQKVERRTVQCKKDNPMQKRQSKPRRQSNARKESKTKRQDTIQHKPL